ncbi:hypothetical protein WS71_17245 [Burkholderia mayonis]|uniref:Alcohol dehydrogenase-like N-terminal domain-containing protein n=1 Tax=Burkholderia mayonis TaxID=1385591 RepID=A0A1B4FZM8_9BURK|nr:hypothetical protein WS71_17245 [Burkholderia mayonis]KVE55799.1 hypothetical protein WS71_29255 [Burkholderia mayonis]
MRESGIDVNFVDTYFRSGLYPVASLPAGLGFEGAGVVDAVGREIARLRPGGLAPVRPAQHIRSRRGFSRLSKPCIQR